jgi:hypothetical protein
MTSFSALAILRVNRRSWDLSYLLAFVAANAALGLDRNGIARRVLRCRVFIAGGAAAALASWDLVLLAGGPWTVSNLAFSLVALLFRLGSSLLLLLTLGAGLMLILGQLSSLTLGAGLMLILGQLPSLTLGADLLLILGQLPSFTLGAGSVGCDLVLYRWCRSSLGTVGGEFVLRLSSLAVSSMLLAPSTNRCKSRASVDAPCPPNPLIVFTTSFIATMTLSAFVIDGLVIRLCLKSTVSENLSLLVSFMWHVCVL